MSPRISKRNSGMEFKEVVKKLEEYARLDLAESWDNVGVLVEPPNISYVSKVLLTNDLTLAVMNEAESKNVNLIISYHPPVFKPLKRITTSHWKERIVGRCLSKGIAVYSPHTCYDAVEGGINDWLISAFGNGHVTAIQVSLDQTGPTHKVEIVNTNDDHGKLMDALSRISGITYLAGTDDRTITLYCNEGVFNKILQATKLTAGAPSCTITKLEKNPLLNHGLGRFVVLDKPLTLREAVEAVRKHLGLARVRLAVRHDGKEDDIIKSVAVCAGSGISVLRGTKADLVLTGEMSHHEVLDMAQQGRNVILTDHSNSERGFLSAVLQKKLIELFERKVDVVVSERDEDPLKIV